MSWGAMETSNAIVGRGSRRLSKELDRYCLFASTEHMGIFYIEQMHRPNNKLKLFLFLILFLFLFIFLFRRS